MTDTVIFYDTEYTAWEGSQQRRWSEPWEHREVIQIAAIKVDLRHGFVEQSAFDRFVKPQHNPILSDYISNLTGIQQSSIDTHGVPFVDAWADFYQFCEQGKHPLFSWGDDPGVLRENCCLTGLDFSAFRWNTMISARCLKSQELIHENILAVRFTRRCTFPSRCQAITPCTTCAVCW